MGSQAERAARNEATFREINESIEDVAERLQSRECGFVCECSTLACVELVTLTLAEYEHVRAHGARFFLVPDHEDAKVERVVEQNVRFAVVEKTGEAGAVAESLDPRA